MEKPRRHDPYCYPSVLDRPNTSLAAFTFCPTALDWGFGVEGTAARLVLESTKYKENGNVYAQRTAHNAAAALERRKGQGR